MHTISFFVTMIKYIFAAVFDKEPFRNIFKIKLSPEAAILMDFSKSLFCTYIEILRNITVMECNF